MIFRRLTTGLTSAARGTAPATSSIVLAEVIYQYRALIGKCELGLGLDWDEIEQVAVIEAAFAPSIDDRRMATGRRFRREKVRMEARLRGDRINDQIDLVELGPGGLVIRNAPYVSRGEQVEVVIDGKNGTSYRFRARGVWLRDDGDDYCVGLAFVGMPVRIRKVALSHHETDVVDKIVAEAA